MLTQFNGPSDSLQSLVADKLDLIHGPWTTTIAAFAEGAKDLRIIGGSGQAGIELVARSSPLYQSMYSAPVCLSHNTSHEQDYASRYGIHFPGARSTQYLTDNYVNDDPNTDLDDVTNVDAERRCNGSAKLRQIYFQNNKASRNWRGCA